MPSLVPNQTDKKVKNVKTPPIPHIEPINNLFNFMERYKLGYDIFKAFKDIRIVNNEIKIPAPGEGLPRVLHYLADQSGCGFWRMIWPGDELMAYNKAVIMSLYQMVLAASFYQGIDAIRLQRQCTETQLEFVKFLRQVSTELEKQTGKKMRLIYEVDDVVVPVEDIPDYNVCKPAFTDRKIHNIMKEVVHLCDEMVVVSPYMRDHYKKHLDYDKISVIPNYAPKTWLDRGFDMQKVVDNYRAHKKKPRIIYAGSVTHFDVANKVSQQDDFTHIVDYIINDIVKDHKYEWVFLGGVPLKLRQFIGKGVELHDWTAVTEYPDKLKSLNGNVMIAPLYENNFNRAKSNLKLYEGGALGLPVIAQDLDCYNADWKYLFKTGPELMSQIASIVGNEKSYKESVKYAREYAEKYWLKDHLDEWVLLYTTGYGSHDRKKNEWFVKNNPQQLQ